MRKKAPPNKSISKSQCVNANALEKHYTKKGKKGFLPNNPGGVKGPRIVSAYIKKLTIFDDMADWVNKKFKEGDEKIISASHLSLLGKVGGMPTEDKEKEPFDLGSTKTVTDIKNALERIIQAEAAGKITHEEADAFEKRLATMFTYIQAAAHESIKALEAAEEDQIS